MAYSGAFGARIATVVPGPTPRELNPPPRLRTAECNSENV